MRPFMCFKKMFPHMLIACFTLSLSATPIAAQTVRPRRVTAAADLSVSTRREDDPIIISLDADSDDEATPSAVPAATHPSRLTHFDQLLLTAIDQRLGARYVYGAAGPNVFDCSGFVWSAFQSAGIRFDRSSARALWAQFAPAREEEEYKFGTLVFFKNLTHIGIVADENGFYHASRHHGVTYSPFNRYWTSRIDGFRRVPLPAPLMAE